MKNQLTDPQLDSIFSKHHNPTETPWTNWRRYAREIIDAERALNQAEPIPDTFTDDHALLVRTVESRLIREQRLQAKQDPVAYANAKQLAARLELPAVDWGKTGYCTVPLYAEPLPDRPPVALIENGRLRWYMAEARSCVPLELLRGTHLLYLAPPKEAESPLEQAHLAAEVLVKKESFNGLTADLGLDTNDLRKIIKFIKAAN